MLSDNAIDNLIGPFLLRQEQMSNYVVGVIAERIKEFGTLTPSDVYTLQQLLKNGGDVKKINTYLATYTTLQVKEIQDIIKTVAQDSYAFAEPFYNYQKVEYVPFEQNEQLQKTVESVSRNTVNSYVNLSKAQAFMVRDLRNPKKLIPTSLSQTYYSCIDEAVQATQQGITDYNTAMRRTLTQLGDSGIQTVVYNTESGRIYHQRLDTAVRRNILDGVREINQGVQDVTGEQYGADGKEITVHANSAPDHEPIQGHQFTNEEYEKLQNQENFMDSVGNEFEAIQRPIGVWNCRHFTYSVILGINKPNFTLEQLDEMKKKNAKGYTSPSGKHYTMYECTQNQRAYETNIRKAKDLYLAAEKAGDTELMAKAKAKVAKLTKEYRAFSNACGLKPKMDRAKVLGYDR